jgi:hypothetical protein
VNIWGSRIMLSQPLVLLTGAVREQRQNRPMWCFGFVVFWRADRINKPWRNRRDDWADHDGPCTNEKKAKQPTGRLCGRELSWSLGRARKSKR